MIDLSDKPKEFLYFYDCVKRNESFSMKIKLLTGAKMVIDYSVEMGSVYIEGNTPGFQFLSLDFARDEFLINCKTIDDFIGFVNKRIISAGELFKKTSGEW